MFSGVTLRGFWQEFTLLFVFLTVKFVMMCKKTPLNGTHTHTHTPPDYSTFFINISDLFNVLLSSAVGRMIIKLIILQCVSLQRVQRRNSINSGQTQPPPASSRGRSAFLQSPCQRGSVSVTESPLDCCVWELL